MIERAAAPTPPYAYAETFYADALRALSNLGLPFLLAGTYAFCADTGVTRPTKDLDVFCQPDDWSRILQDFKDCGYTVVIEDKQLLGKVFRGTDSFDVIFSSRSGMGRSAVNGSSMRERARSSARA